jgi:ribonuclease HI
VVAALAQFLPQVSDPSMAEVVALWKAVCICKELGYDRVIFEGDSLLVVEAVGHEGPCWRNFGHIIEEIRTLFGGFHSFEVKHVKRVANQAAHGLANLVLS